MCHRFIIMHPKHILHVPCSSTRHLLFHLRVNYVCSMLVSLSWWNAPIRQSSDLKLLLKWLWYYVQSVYTFLGFDIQDSYVMQYLWENECCGKHRLYILEARKFFKLSFIDIEFFSPWWGLRYNDVVPQQLQNKTKLYETIP